VYPDKVALHLHELRKLHIVLVTELFAQACSMHDSLTAPRLPLLLKAVADRFGKCEGGADAEEQPHPQIAFDPEVYRHVVGANQGEGS
jgi:hypothetical protein